MKKTSTTGPKPKPWRNIPLLGVALLWNCEFTEEFHRDTFDVRMLTGRKFYGLIWRGVILGWTTTAGDAR